MAIRFKRGASGCTSDDAADEEEITALSMRLAGLLGTWRTVTLYPTAEAKDAFDGYSTSAVVPLPAELKCTLRAERTSR
jgi:hypothetical protein